ncbi:ornithine cyclodeaminase family protein [Rhodococcus sp. D2-41]|uniref:Ornithine cyclodeaminase family protein n=1 Tax=Speluncibacter jeojiensis TaxID=2710754 RepID=A0A9X4LWU0_9ACTN|nr:ornithine cyclodeaminase family protein [Rhodococcus sp. D2-41]MDG3010828.1 ornithine cyclodeaminase family protein [Rhodococcus sp. D2-41]MDG3013800.1 ornithine cyclodeaminase family protein [Corynebacteriales bacterium D3-21]
MTEPAPPSFLDSEAVRAALPMAKAIELMDTAMRRYCSGQVTQPLRTIIRPQTETGLLGTMPCHVAGDEYCGFGLKAMVLRPENPAQGLPLHIGVVMVFDPDTGAPSAVMDAGAITAIRTAAVSAVATRALSTAGAGDLAILGAGVQARSHLEAMAAVRPLRRVRVWNRTHENAIDYQNWAAAWLDVPVEVMDDPAAALDGADLICTTMATKEPLVEAPWLAAGAHLNAVGGSFADARELTSDAVARTTIVVDSLESALAESGDLRHPLQEGLIAQRSVTTQLGEVLLGDRPGRTTDHEITLFKSLGLAVEDIMSGLYIAETLSGATEPGSEGRR